MSDGRDVEIRFEGDSRGAVDAAAAIDAALKMIQELAGQVSRALGDLKIGSGVVTGIETDAARINRALGSVEDQAKDTERALNGLGGLTLLETAVLGGSPRTMLAAAQRNLPFLGYPLPDRNTGPFASPLTGVESNIPYRRPLSQSALNMAVMAEAARYRPSALEQGFLGMAPNLSAPAPDSGSRGTADGSLLAALGMTRTRRLGGFGLGRFMPRLPYASFGTPLALAGFGLERLLGSTLGIGGSLLGGALGGGVYAGGMLGTMAVGMGTDMAGIGQAAGDIRKTTQAYTNLQQAVALYGKNSSQAQAAQAQLNYTLAGFNPVARQAVLHATLVGQQFKSLFDKYTGGAEKTGAQIITQGMQTGMPFLPVIGKFAGENMKIIQSGLQPLFKWMDQSSGGLGIFTNLEQLFQKRLPTAVHAGTQAFEVFLHAIDDAAQHTGGFITKLDQFFTRLNTPAGLGQVAHGVNVLIGLFHTWIGLFGAVGHALYDLLKPAVGLGADFAVQLTRLVNLTRQWLSASGTQNVLRQLFGAHKAQMDAIFGVFRQLLPILENVLSAFFQVEAIVTKITIGPLRLLAWILKEINSIPLADKILGWAGAIGVTFFAVGKLGTALVLLKDKFLLNLVGPMVSGAKIVYGALMRLVAGFAADGVAATTSAVVVDEAMAAEAVAVDATTTQVGVLRTALLSLGGTSVLGALGALGAALTRLGGPIAGAGMLASLGASLGGVRMWTRPGSAGTGGAAQFEPPSSAQWEIQKDWKEIGPGVYRTADGKYLYWDPQSGTLKDTSKAGAEKMVKDRRQHAGDGHGHDAAGGGLGAGMPGAVRGLAGPGLSTGSRQAPSAAAGTVVSEASTYGVGSGGVYATGGGHGAQVSPGSALDCSGYVYQSFTAAGFQGFPGTSETQWSTMSGKNWFSKVVAPGDAQPGDVVFMVGSGYKSPGHVGIVTSGSGASAKVMQYYQPGKPADTIPLNQIQDFVGMKRFYLVQGANRNVGSSTPTVPGVTSSSAGTTKAGTQASRISTGTAAARVLADINKALNIHALINSVVTPADPLTIHPLAAARAKLEPELRKWREQIAKFAAELRDKTIPQSTVDVISARIGQISQKVQGALREMQQAAQKQAQAAMQVWDQMTQQFQQNFGQITMAGAQLQQLQGEIAKAREAIILDQAQSQVLGGKSSTSGALDALNQMEQTLHGGQGGGGKYHASLEQILHALAKWEVFYARKGYTPKQMVAAFEKLLASWGYAGMGGYAYTAAYGTGDLPLPGGDAHHHHHANRHAQHQAAHHGRHVTKRVAHGVHHSGGGHAPGNAAVPHHMTVELTVNDQGQHWLDNVIDVRINGELAKQGKRTYERARSGRR